MTLASHRLQDISSRTTPSSSRTGGTRDAFCGPRFMLIPWLRQPRRAQLPPPRPIRSPFLPRSRTSPTLLPAVVLELNITDFADPHETQAMPWLSRLPVESAVMIPRDEHSSQGQDLPHQFDLEPTRNPRWNFYEFSLLGGKMSNFSELFLQMEMMSWKSIFLVACRGVSA